MSGLLRFIQQNPFRDKDLSRSGECEALPTYLFFSRIFEVVNLVGSVIDGPYGRVDNIAELTELSLGGAKHLPNPLGWSLKCQRTKPRLTPFWSADSVVCPALIASHRLADS